MEGQGRLFHTLKAGVTQDCKLLNTQGTGEESLTKTNKKLGTRGVSTQVLLRISVYIALLGVGGGGGEIQLKMC